MTPEDRTPADLDLEDLVRRLVGGDEAAATHLVALADAGCTDPSVNVAAAVLEGSPRHLRAATAGASHPRDRQLVALAEAHLRPDPERFDALVRDHLVTYPDHLLASWLATRAGRSTTRTGTRPETGGLR